MANILLYDPAGIVPNMVTKYVISANTPEYNIYPNKIISPNVSALINVPIQWWKVVNTSVVEMDASEKALLPIAPPTQNPIVGLITRINILGQVIAAAEPATQLPRILDAVDGYCSFVLALDHSNYTLARSRLATARQRNVINQADYDLIISFIPA